MPLKIIKSGSGFKVSDGKITLSKKPMTKKQAEKQRIAVALSIHQRRGKLLKNIFI